MPAPFRILGIDHVVLRAADPAALEKFYVDVLGCTVEKRQEAISLTQLRAGRTLIDIIPAATGGPGGRRAGRARRQHGSSLPAHRAVRCGGDQQAFRRARLRRGEEKSRFGADGQGPSVYLLDPEGNGVELKGPPAQTAAIPG